MCHVLDIRRNFFIGSVLKHCKRFLREAVGFPSLEVFERHRNMVLEDVVQARVR